MQTVFRKECREYIAYRDKAAKANGVENLRLSAAYNEYAKLALTMATYTSIHYGERKTI